ncbi:MAG: PD-(D/E)XK motif protein [Pirellulaceae bacterium]
MSIEWQDILRAAWAELSRHPARTRQFRTQRLSPTLELGAYAALRAADESPCLLIEADVVPASLFEVGGMRLNTYPGDNGPLLVLTLEDAGRADLFTTVCADAVAAATSAPSDEALPQFLARLDAWRRFLRERRAGLTRNETVGLLGELLLLERLVQADGSMLATWTSPDDGLHDFLVRGQALEVKTSLGPASAMRISTLDQLDPSGLRRLDLVHVRLVETPDGRSLGNVIAAVERALPDESARRAFANALLRRGLMPDDTAARSAPLIDLRAFSAYAVGERFPKLVRTSVPAAVQDAEYSLELRAIDAYAIDFEAAATEFTRGRAA